MNKIFFAINGEKTDGRGSKTINLQKQINKNNLILFRNHKFLRKKKC